MKVKTNQDFITKADLIHNNKYDYSKTNYINSKTKISIICDIHGEFTQTPNNHLNGSGCVECGRLRTQQFHTKTPDQFIFEANTIHNNKYDYSNAIYVNDHTKISICCNTHGIFEQTRTRSMLYRW